MPSKKKLASIFEKSKDTKDAEKVKEPDVPVSQS